SSHVDRSVSTDDSELSVKSLIKNLKNVIMKKLSVSCMIRSLTFFSTLSVSFSATLSQSSTSVSVSDFSSTTSVPVTLTSATSGFTASAFIISSPHFKKMLYRLSESHFSAKDIHVFRNENTDVVLFYTCRYETHIPCLKCHYKNELFTCCVLLSVFSYISLSLSEKPHACFTSVSEIILIKDNNTAETISLHSQASSITFSLFSAEKVVYILSCK
ncbi:hypothetical protein BDDG_13586, partial [Blastomyces dermatitidis ATCC 18188]